MNRRKLYKSVFLFVLVSFVLFSSSGCSRKRLVYGDDKTQSAITEKTVESEQAQSPEPKKDEPLNDFSENSENEQEVNTEQKSSDIKIKMPEQNKEQAKTSEQGDTVGAIIDHYSKILDQGIGTLYECHIPYVYLELEENYLTVNRKSYLHKLILEAGGYNRAEKRADASLRVDNAWIKRNNPDVIIKFVSSPVLGFGVKNTEKASILYKSFIARDGFDGLSALINQKVILLSSELLKTEQGKLSAKLYIAKTMHPELFSDMNVDSIYKELTGSQGLCFYTA